MKKLLLTACVLTGLSLNVSASEVHWGYEGHGAPENWDKLSPEFNLCSKGQNQSPININSVVKAELAPLQIEFHPDTEDMVNNGHTVQIDAANESVITIDGERFSLKQFHFHAPSENQIAGKSFPMEAHFVHANDKGELLVLALMFNEGTANAELAHGWQQLSKNINDKQPLITPVDVEKLLPKELTYYRFSGSLTTPPCSEGVRWLVLKQPVTASTEQIKQFESLMGHHNNRPVQSTNGRVVVG